MRCAVVIAALWSSGLVASDAADTPIGGVARLQPPPPGQPQQVAGDQSQPRPEPGAGAPAEPGADRPVQPPSARGGSRDLRHQMREYGERYGEYSRDRHENMRPAPPNGRWLSDPERNRFREELRERYQQRR